ncbi:MAG: hypothetical protein A2351_00255 [Omnitrophica bacterium RIFOXYB12_FULL_50_7]|nr:MAG: hypothetical protein A2351_00255 [Omnitrophica bacterium RIFOXYB12_FULL_50_7]
MEWFWRLVDHFQKSVVGSVLQGFSASDWTFSVLIFWGAIQGSRKGFSDMFGKLLGVFLVSMLTLSFYKIGAEKLVSFLPVFSVKVAQPLSFFLLSVCLWFVVSKGVDIFGKFFKIEALGILKTLGGMAFGILKMLLLLSFIAQFLLLLQVEPIQNVFSPGHTYTGYTISRFAPDLHKLVVSPFHKPVSKKIAESVRIGG